MINLSEDMFGKPLERGASKEKYEFPVLTMEAWRGKGTAKRFALNKAASELLVGESASVGFVFQEEAIYLANTTDTNAKESYEVTKGTPRTFSNAKIYDYIVKTLELDNSVDNEFNLEQLNDTLYNNYPVLSVSLLSHETQVIEEEIVAHVESDVEYADRVAEIDRFPVTNEQEQEVNPFQQTVIVE